MGDLVISRTRALGLARVDCKTAVATLAHGGPMIGAGGAGSGGTVRANAHVR